MKNSRMVPVKIEDAEVEKGVAWFFAFEYNGLYSKDLSSGEVSYWGVVPDEKTEQMRLYSTIRKIGDKIFLIPNEAEELAVFDIESSKYKKINISNSIAYDEHIRYMGVVLYEDNLYIFGLTKPVIIKLNIKTYATELVIDLKETLSGLDYDLGDIYFRKQIVEINGKIYAPLCMGNVMLELDCKTLQSKIYRVGKEPHGYTGISSDDGMIFYLAPMFCDGEIIKWHKEKGVIARGVSSSEKKEFAYAGVCKLCEKYVFFPADYRDCEERELVEGIEFAEGNYTFAKRTEEKVIAYEKNRNVICLWDGDTEKKETDILVPVEWTRLKQMAFAGKLYEKNSVSIDYLIEMIKENNEELKKGFGNIIIGEKIYQTLI